MPPRPHGHEEEEEEIHIPVDGPPFIDVHAKQGRGFEVDYDKVQKYLGPGKITLSDYMRDMEQINKVYLPVVHKSYVYMRMGSGCMLAGLVIFIIMGIVGGTPDIRSIVIPVALTIFLLGFVAFLYSKWVEQGVIKEAAASVRKVLDDVINPRYADSAHRIHWVVWVQERSKKSYHMGRTLLERPVVSIYILRSEDASGSLRDWSLPQAYLSGLVTVPAGGAELAKSS